MCVVTGKWQYRRSPDHEVAACTCHWAENSEVQVSVETLQRYVLLTRTPRYSDTGGNTNSAQSRLVPRSETAFDCTCGLGFVFTVGADGVASEVSEVHVSGARPFKRVR